MESASEEPGAMAAAEATCDPSPSSAVPPPPPVSSSASTKRRWSPCTWRYAIEDAQAELPSRPRATTTASSSSPLSAAAPPPSSRSASSSSPLQPPIKAKPPHYNPLYGKAAEEPQKISSHSPRLHSHGLKAHVRLSPSQVSKSGAMEAYRKSQRHLHPSKVRACEEDEEETGGEAEQDDQDDDDDDEGFPVFDEEYFKMRRREMSPSEQYFCAICSGKAAEVNSTAPGP